MVVNVVRLHASTTQRLTDVDIKLFNETITKFSSGEKKFGGSYKPAETEAGKLEGRLAFLKQQLFPFAQFETITELVLLESSFSDVDKLMLGRAVELVKMWGVSNA